jgi:hypothetical protein
MELQNVFDAVFEFGFGYHTRYLVNDFSVLEKDKRWYGLYAKFAWCHRIVINIAFGEFNLASVRAGKVFDDGTNSFAGAAPRRPKVHNGGFVGLNDLLIKAAVIYILDPLCHIKSSFLGGLKTVSTK